MQIKQLTPQDVEWAAYCAHLRACNHAQWVLDDNNQPKDEAMIFIGGMVDGEVVGSLTLIVQPITVPETEWVGDRERTIPGPDGNPLTETLVETFYVDRDHRRHGIGQALQEKALEITAAQGCCQMRSWSSLDKPANYQLKLKLGFGFHPEVQVTASGLKVSGGYFVKRVS